MRSFSITIFFFLISLFTFSQEMTIDKLEDVLKKTTDKLESKGSRWSFVINDVPFIAIADSKHNRMRIISPIMEAAKLSDELKTAALMANFHTALDIKYAITDAVLWSIFVHPLKELSEEQLIDALSQVYYGNTNFGTTFSSTSLVFPGRMTEKKSEEKNNKSKIIKKI